MAVIVRHDARLRLDLWRSLWRWRHDPGRRLRRPLFHDRFAFFLPLNLLLRARRILLRRNRPFLGGWIAALVPHIGILLRPRVDGPANIRPRPCHRFLPSSR